jgi:hypothetical protein
MEIQITKKPRHLTVLASFVLFEDVQSSREIHISLLRRMRVLPARRRESFSSVPGDSLTTFTTRTNNEMREEAKIEDPSHQLREFITFGNAGIRRHARIYDGVHVVRTGC